MAGIWERIRPDTTDRLSMHLLDACIVLYATGAFTAAQIRTGLETKLDTPLTAAEAADLTQLAANLDAAGSATNKLVFQQKVMAWLIAAESGLVTEAAFRAALGL